MSGGRVDSVMMRIVDILMSIPFMFVLILMLVMFGRSLLMLFIGIGLISWLAWRGSRGGRRCRSRTRSSWRPRRHGRAAPHDHPAPHRPEPLGVVIVYATLLIPEMIIYESFISFLGLGVQEPNTSLGALISRGAGQIGRDVPWQLGFPLFFFVVMLFAFYFVGDGLRDAIDPKDR
jgi:oligopeptide transport system permease protein